jgi:hypothetical protein
VKLDLEHRKKGLLWYPTYTVNFGAAYTVKNRTSQPVDMIFEYHFPQQEGVYDNFRFVVDGDSIGDLNTTGGAITRQFSMEPGQSRTVELSYRTQGMEEWWYMFGNGVSQIRNFRLTMTTDFADIDFPENGISPTDKKSTADGWELTWQYDNLLSGVQIGMVMPQKLNPGPFVARVSFFAPVSLFFFFFVLFMITGLRGINLHPMNYFFFAAAFFAFHLLFAYLVDHISVHTAFVICSAISIFLVVSYMRLVVGLRFALIETGISQLIYLVAFSYAFFLEGYTGLAITVCAILTLFVVMQLTGRINWDERFAELEAPKSLSPVPPPPPSRGPAGTSPR